MHSNITILIHTYNEEKNIKSCIESVKNIAQEIIVIDNNSQDNTVAIASNLGAHVYKHKYSGHVEKSRVFGVTKVKTDWIFVLDADERSSLYLNNILLNLINKSNKYNVVLIPRQNYIFGKWIQHTAWWPDHQARFFKKGYVTWTGDIDVVNIKTSKVLYLQSLKSLSLKHYNYQSIDDFIGRLNKYTSYYSQRLLKEKAKVNYFTPFIKAIKEFNNRFYYSEGYKDGYVGLILSLFMGLYFFLAYIKVIEKRNNLVKFSHVLILFQMFLLLMIIKLFFWFFISILILIPYRYLKSCFRKGYLLLIA